MVLERKIHKGVRGSVIMYLPHKHEDLNSVSRANESELGVVVCAYNPSSGRAVLTTGLASSGGSWALGLLASHPTKPT